MRNQCHITVPVRLVYSQHTEASAVHYTSLSICRLATRWPCTQHTFILTHSHNLA